MFWIKYFSYDSLILLKRVVALPYMNNYRIMHFYTTFVTVVLYIWMTVNGKEKIVGLCESDRHSITIYHIKQL